MKPYWNMELTYLSRGQKKIMWEWRAAGWTRVYDSEVFRRCQTHFSKRKEKS